MRWPKAPSWFGKLALELVVIFVGVYAAFAMSQYQAQRETRHRREELQAALAREIKDITANTRRVSQQLPVELATFDSNVRAGTRPLLQPRIEPVRVQTHMWEATLQSGGLNLFDVNTVYNLSRFYNELNAGFEQLAQLRALSETLLMPNLERGSSEFYASDGRSLRPKYRWYRDGLGRLSQLAQSITVLGDTLLAQLEAASTVAPR
jgi:hypothetical protein